jgi:hypothetical protein
VETARKLGCDESEEIFERTFEKTVPPKNVKQLGDAVPVFL